MRADVARGGGDAVCAADLAALYASLQGAITKRLGEFAALWKRGGDKALWQELCFCTCTPQNDAKKAFAAVSRLDDEGLLENGTAAALARVLRGVGVRFHNNKAAYIHANRKRFYPETKRRLRELIFADGRPVAEARNLLAKTVHGWGLKEASHFLRNTGFGSELCILDRHILRSLVRCKVIDALPPTLSAKKYAQIESAMTAFARAINIPLDALDLLFWYQAKGELFK